MLPGKMLTQTPIDVEVTIILQFIVHPLIIVVINPGKSVKKD